MQSSRHFMKSPSLKIALLVATLAVAGQAFSAEGAKPLPADERAGSKAPEKGTPRVLDAANGVEKMREALATRTQTYNTERAKMLDQLKTANEEQRRAILAKMKEQEETLLESARELAKQARDDIKKQRAAAASSPGGGRR